MLLEVKTLVTLNDRKKSLLAFRRFFRFCFIFNLLFNFFHFLNLSYGSELKIEAQPYLFLNEEEVHSFFNLSFNSFKKLSPNTYYELDSQLDLTTIKNSLNDNYFFNLTGTKYLTKQNPFVFSFGFLEHKYGLSRISSPLDFVDQKNYTNLTNPQRFSDFSLRTSFHLGKTFWRLSYIPYRFKMPFPGNNSFWLPRTLPASVADGSDAVLFPDNPTYEWQDYLQLDSSHKNNFALIGKYETKNWDWTWQYYQGLDTDTNIEVELNTVLINPNTVETQYPILLRPIHNKIDRAGFGFVYTTPIKWRVVFENSISLGDTNNAETETEEYIYNSSASLEWGVPMFGNILMGVFQGFYGKSSNDPSGTTAILPPLQKAALLGLLWKESRYELSAGFIKSYSLDIDIVQSSFQLNFNKNFYLKLNSLFISGDIPELLSGFIDSDLIETYIGYKKTI